MVGLEFERCVAEFEAETARLAAAALVWEAHTRVPTCPEWTVRDLITHVGTGHRWATEIVRRRTQDPPPYAMVDAPHDCEEWADWSTTGARWLVDAIRDGGPHQPVWTWRTEATAEFWLRKMLHDVVVHRLDVELIGGNLSGIAPDLAVEGVSDLLASIAALSSPDSPDPLFGGLAGTGQTLRLQATDPGLGAAGEWLVERTPAGVTWRHGHAPAQATVRAPARELLLVLNRRLDLAGAGVDITGDRTLFIYWLEHSRF